MTNFIKSDIGMSFLGMGYHFGSINEGVGQRGCSHLMEHLQCKPLDKMLPELTRLGVDYNAYTSDDRVVFHFTGLEANVKAVSKRVMDKVRWADPLWTEEDFNTEKQTVLQEYGDSFNSQETGAYYNLMRKHYDYAGAIGIKEDIENFSYEESINFSKKFNDPNQVVLVASEDFVNVPDVGFDTTFRRRFHFTEDSGMPLESVPKEGKSVIGLLGYNVLDTTDASELAALKFTMRCLNSGLESPLNQEIREKRGLSYYSSDALELLGTTAVPFFMASTSNERAQELKDVYTEFFTGDVSRWITEDRFNDVMDNHKISEQKRIILPFSGLGPRKFNPFNNEGIDKLTYKDVLDYAITYLTMDSFYLYDC